MEADGSPPDDALLPLPWLPVTMGGRHLLAKSLFGGAAYRVLLTDLQGVWEESMEPAAIQKRAKELNPRLRASSEAFFSHLREVAQPCLGGGASGVGGASGEVGGVSGVGGAQVTLDRRGGGAISVRLRSELAGLNFYWEFHCSPAPGELVCSHLVRPLLVVGRLLQRGGGQLGALLRRKDAEIQDYKEGGATLSRERLQTEAFEEQTYRNELLTKTLPGLLSEDSDPRGFDPGLQHLYAAAVSRATAPKRARHEEPGGPPPAKQEVPPRPDPDAVCGDPDVVGGDPDVVGVEPPPARTRKQVERKAPPKPKKKKVGLFG
ncbi:non-homologous end-joining factor 1 isoform 2-T2 [Menidia menidia]